MVLKFLTPSFSDAKPKHGCPSDTSDRKKWTKDTVGHRQEIPILVNGYVVSLRIHEHL
jgi:hypothetical protein